MSSCSGVCFDLLNIFGFHSREKENGVNQPWNFQLKQSHLQGPNEGNNHLN